MSAYIAHLTLSTGHSRRSARREVDDGVLTIVRESLDSALSAAGCVVSFPGPQPLGLSATADGRALLATFWAPLTAREAAIASRSASPWEPLVTLGVALKATVGARLWPQLLASADSLLAAIERPQAPWAAAILHPACDDHTDVMAWIGDAERCLAWAWMETGR